MKLSAGRVGALASPLAFRLSEALDELEGAQANAREQEQNLTYLLAETKGYCLFLETALADAVRAARARPPADWRNEAVGFEDGEVVL